MCVNIWKGTDANDLLEVFFDPVLTYLHKWCPVIIDLGRTTIIYVYEDVNVWHTNVCHIFITQFNTVVYNLWRILRFYCYQLFYDLSVAFVYYTVFYRYICSVLEINTPSTPATRYFRTDRLLSIFGCMWRSATHIYARGRITNIFCRMSFVRSILCLVMCK